MVITELRALVRADEEPPRGAAELVARGSPDVVITLGDLPRDWLAGLRDLDVPRIGVLGNDDVHGHTTPDPRRSTSRLGETAVFWVRGVRVLML